MKSVQCPKCGSEQIFHETNGIYVPQTLGTFIRTDSSNWGSTTDDYICTNCGYIERYVTDEKKLKEVAKKWQRAG